MTALADRLTVAMKDAMRARDKVAVGALRSVLGVLSNAEAVPADDVDVVDDSAIAGAVKGVGASERPRRELTEDEAAALVRAEIEDRRTAAEEYRGLGQADHAERLEAEAELLESHIS